MAQTALPRLLLDAHRALDGEVAGALGDRGVELSPSQARALLLVDRAGIRLTELAGRAAISKQAMMQIVDGLQGLGLLRRSSDPADGRAKVVRMTAKGLRQRARARQAVSSVEVRAKRRLGPRRYDALRAALEDLTLPEE